MWQVNKNAKGAAQVSFRIPDADLDEFNAYAKAVQEESAQDFSSCYDYIRSLIKSNKELESINSGLSHDFKMLQAELEDLKSQEIESVELIPEDLKNAFDEIKDSIFDGENLTEKEMLDTLIQIVNTPAPVVPQVEEKIIEVERKLSDNEVLVELKTPQIDALNFIADYRFKKKLDPERLTLAGVIRGLAFKPGPLTNWLNEFETGIRNPNAPQK